MSMEWKETNKNGEKNQNVVEMPLTHRLQITVRTKTNKRETNFAFERESIPADEGISLIDSISVSERGNNHEMKLRSHIVNCKVLLFKTRETSGDDIAFVSLLLSQRSFASVRLNHRGEEKNTHSSRILQHD